MYKMSRKFMLLLCDRVWSSWGCYRARPQTSFSGNPTSGCDWEWRFSWTYLVLFRLWYRMERPQKLWFQWSHAVSPKLCAWRLYHTKEWWSKKRDYLQYLLLVTISLKVTNNEYVHGVRAYLICDTKGWGEKNLGIRWLFWRLTLHVRWWFPTR